MTVPRIYIPQALKTGAVCSATADQARYIQTVLRMREGDSLFTFDGMGWEYQAVVRRLTTKGAELEITGRRRLSGAGIHIALCQAVPKADKMEGIIRHATELGVEKIIPFLAERSVPRWRPEQLPRKRERWQKIAVEASRQCGRPDVPEVGLIVSFDGMLQDVPESGLRLIPWEEESETDIREILRDPSRSGLNQFILVIGPEGGFSYEEIERARRAGFIPVSLGKRVLRVETASLAVLAILQYEKGGAETESTA